MRHGESLDVGERASRGAPIGEHAASEWAGPDGPHAVRLAQRQEAAVHRPTEKVVPRLTALESDDSMRAARAERADELLDAEVRAPDAANFAGLNELVQRPQCLLDGGMWVEHVHLVEVDVVGLESTQTRLA